MPQLDKYLVTLEAKGQDLVLSQMDKIQKKGHSISKTKTVADLVAKTGKGAGKGTSAKAIGQEKEKRTPEKIVEQEKESAKTSKGLKALAKDLTDGGKKVKQFTKDTNASAKEQEKASKDKKDSELKKIKEGASQGVSNVGHGMASLNPASLIHGLASIPGLIPHTGTAGKVIGGAATLSTTAGVGAMEIAKNAVARSSELYQRNATTSNYGGDRITQGNMSNNEKAAFVTTIAGSLGKIQKPMADALNNLSGRKDTGALAQVGAGNWRSTGTDKGFFLQKLSDSFGDLPPSIAQKFQSKLLENYGGEIQESTASQRKTQGRNAAFEASGENKDFAINKVLDEEHKTKYKNPKTGKIETETTTIYASTVKAYEDMNKAMVDMVRLGTEFTGFLTDASKAVSTLSTAAAHGAAKIRSFFYSTKP
jgi:hypothetical protein